MTPHPWEDGDNPYESKEALHSQAPCICECRPELQRQPKGMGLCDFHAHACALWARLSALYPPSARPREASGASAHHGLRSRGSPLPQRLNDTGLHCPRDALPLEPCAALHSLLLLPYLKALFYCLQGLPSLQLVHAGPHPMIQRVAGRRAVCVHLRAAEGMPTASTCLP